jgi:hypothetical protein
MPTALNTDLNGLDINALRTMVAEQYASIERLQTMIGELRRVQLGQKSEDTNQQIGHPEMAAFWTFPVPGTDSFVATPSDSEDLLLLNPTAAWLWENRNSPNLACTYAEHFGITFSQAETDIRQTMACWDHLLNPYVLTLAINGTFFRVQLESQQLIDEIEPRIKALQVPGAPFPAHTFRLFETGFEIHIHLDGKPFASQPFATAARALLLQELTRLAVPNRDFSAILHAGACGNNSAAMILAGASFAGKSTLCAALVEAGYLCYSDDSACLTRSWEVAGMPFALAMRDGKRFRPSNLTGSSTSAPVKTLVFVNYQPNAEQVTLDPVDTFSALVALNTSGFWIPHTQQAIKDFLNWLGELPIYRVTYSDKLLAIPHMGALIDGFS